MSDEKIDDGGPACNATLRDVFATAALQGMLASGKTLKIDDREYPFDQSAYIIADAMLKTRKTGAK